MSLLLMRDLEWLALFVALTILSFLGARGDEAPWNSGRCAGERAMSAVRTVRLHYRNLFVDVRLYQVNGRWLASVDTPEGPACARAGPREVLTEALEPFDGIIEAAEHRPARPATAELGRPLRPRIDSPRHQSGADFRHANEQGGEPGGDACELRGGRCRAGAHSARSADGDRRHRRMVRARPARARGRHERIVAAAIFGDLEGRTPDTGNFRPG